MRLGRSLGRHGIEDNGFSWLPNSRYRGPQPQNFASTPTLLTTAGSGMESQVASYPLALLKLMDEGDGSTGQPPLGTASCVGTASSAFDIPAHRLLQALLTHAPSPEPIAKELLVQLGKCGNAVVETLGVLLSAFIFQSDLMDVFKPGMCITRFPLWPQMNGQLWSFRKFDRSLAASQKLQTWGVTTYLIW